MEPGGSCQGYLGGGGKLIGSLLFAVPWSCGARWFMPGLPRGWWEVNWEFIVRCAIVLLCHSPAVP